MSGIGPAPAETRRRRNEPARGEWVDLAPLEGPVLEAADPSWPDHVRRLWEAWRLDPVTAQYSSSEVAAVWELARCYDDLKPAEQRLRADGLGLTAKGKRDLRWRIGGEVAVAPKVRRSQASSSRQKRLSVVK
jgi:hypothetical protein